METPNQPNAEDWLKQLAQACGKDSLAPVQPDELSKLVQAGLREDPIDPHPLVSCIMPTYNRRAFVPQAIEYFLRQDYDNKELVIVDDGTDPVEDLVEENPHLHYSRLSVRQSVGAKRNLACQAANGQIIVHWDDDDWMAPWRLSYQVASLLDGRADICGVNQMLYYDPVADKAWQYIFQEEKPWIAGGSFCYLKSLWRHNPFKEIDESEDNRFLSGVPMHILPLPRIDFYVALVHSRNTSTKRTDEDLYRPLPVDHVKGLIAGDMAFYRVFLAD